MNAKIRSLRNQMTAKGLEGMIVSNPVNIRYLTGLTAERHIASNSKR
ncbi:MAG: aminopeptidase P family N-terminal domain-containing protein [Clostridia bacterium]|nr:aminopeptidase P family N-terminal domain-containing protein [Clostridia bacterium]